MNNQELLLKQIRSQLPTSSINESIAAILNISYDAAHRRVSGKSKFTIDETIALTQYFGLSMDALFLGKNKIVVEKTIEITSQKQMLQYFDNAANTIHKLAQNTNTKLYYSAKDIPLFYFMDGTILSKFKAFVWLKLLDSTQQDITFDDFVIQESFFAPMLKLKKAYQNIQVNEVWNDTTINSSVQQICYFYEAGLLSLNAATSLFLDLKRILKNIKQKSNAHNTKYSIYYNEIVLLNNNLLFETQNELTMFVPYTLLGFFITSNPEASSNVRQWFEQQIKNSKPLNTSGIRDQNQFFDKAIRKIDFYAQQLQNQVNLEF